MKSLHLVFICFLPNCTMQRGKRKYFRAAAQKHREPTHSDPCEVSKAGLTPSSPFPWKLSIGCDSRGLAGQEAPPLQAGDMCSPSRFQTSLAWENILGRGRPLFVRAHNVSLPRSLDPHPVIMSHPLGPPRSGHGEGK